MSKRESGKSRSTGVSGVRKGLLAPLLFRPTERQDAFVRAAAERKGLLSDVLSDMVDLWIDLDAKLGEDGMRQLHARAIIEGASIGEIAGSVLRDNIVKQK